MHRSNHDKADSLAWERMRKRVLAEETVCWVPGCGRPATEVDHMRSLKEWPAGALVRSNLRGVCKPHNSSRQDRPVAEWLTGLASSTRRSSSLPSPVEFHCGKRWCGGTCPMMPIGWIEWFCSAPKQAKQTAKSAGRILVDLEEQLEELES